MKVMIAALALLLAAAAPAPAAAAPVEPKANKANKAKKGKKAAPDKKYWKHYVRYQKRAYLGVHLLPLTRELRGFFRAPEDAGVLVSKVEPDSPAEQAGVQVGDLILELDGQRVANAWQVARQVRDKKEGQKVALKVLRKGEPVALKVALRLREKPTMEVSRFIFRYPGGVVRSPGNWNQRAFQESMKRFKERYQDMASPESLPELKDKERRMEKRLKKLEDKIRKLEKRLQSRRSSL